MLSSAVMAVPEIGKFVIATGDGTPNLRDTNRCISWACGVLGCAFGTDVMTVSGQSTV